MKRKKTRSTLYRDLCDLVGKPVIFALLWMYMSVPLSFVIAWFYLGFLEGAGVAAILSIVDSAVITVLVKIKMARHLKIEQLRSKFHVIENKQPKTG